MNFGGDAVSDRLAQIKRDLESLSDADLAAARSFIDELERQRERDADRAAQARIAAIARERGFKVSVQKAPRRGRPRKAK